MDLGLYPLYALKCYLDFLKRWEKNNRRKRRENRKSGANQIDDRRTNQRPLSTFDDGVILSPDGRYMETPTNPSYAISDYVPNSGISTITRTQLKRVSLWSSKHFFLIKFMVCETKSFFYSFDLGLTSLSLLLLV